MVIGIDGPAGSGKGTITKKVAEILGLVNIDTGAMYRSITLKMLRECIRLENIDKLISLTSVCLDNIIEASRYWDSPAASMAKIGERAYKAIDEYEQWIKDERNK